jgi:hypothetical protein
VDESAQNNEETERTGDMIKNLMRARRILEESPNMSLELAIVHANKQDQTRPNIPPPLDIPLQRQFTTVQSHPINIPDSYSPVTSPLSPNNVSYNPQYRTTSSTNVIHSSSSPVNAQLPHWMSQQHRTPQHRMSYGSPPSNLQTRNIQHEELQTRNRSNSMNALPTNHHQSPHVMHQLHTHSYSQNSSPTGQWNTFQNTAPSPQQNWANRLHEMRNSNTPPPMQQYSPTSTNQWDNSYKQQEFVPIRSSPHLGNSSPIHNFSPTTNQQPFLRFNDRSFLQELNNREGGPPMIMQPNSNMNEMQVDEFYTDQSRFMNDHGHGSQYY